MIKSLSYWSFPAGMSLDEIFVMAKEAGYEAVELTLEAQGEITMDTPVAEVRKIRKRAEDAGLVIPTFATGLFWDYPLVEPGGTIGKEGMAIARKCLQCANALGAGAVLVVPCTVGPDLPYDVAYAKSAEAIEKLIPAAEKAGVPIAVENVWNKFLLSPLEFAAFVDQFKSDWVRAYFDVGNVILTGFPDQWIRILGKRIAAIHFKDFRAAVGNLDGFVDLLEGDVPWEPVMEALKAIKYKGAVTAEMMPPYKYFPRRLIEATSKSMDAILGR